MSELPIRYEAPPSECLETQTLFGERRYQENGVIGEFAPAFEVCETPNSLRIQADVPGVRARDLSVYVVGGKMIVWGRRQHPRFPKSYLFHAYERTYGTFWRTFRPAPTCDLRQTHAMVRKGVLTITVRKNGALRPTIRPEPSVPSPVSQ